MYTEQTPIGNMNLREFMDLRDNKCAGYEFQEDRYRRQLTSFFGCLLHSMAWLSGNFIRHRDVKPENILIVLGADLTAEPGVLICDFGLARDYFEEEAATTETNMRGTYRYKAPELNPPENQRHDEKTDVWALGCVFAEMHTVVCGHSLEELDNEMRKDRNGNIPDGLRERWSFYSRYEDIVDWVEHVSDDSDGLNGGWGRKMLISSMVWLTCTRVRDLLTRPQLKEKREHRKTFNKLIETVKTNEKLFGECCFQKALELTRSASKPAGSASRSPGESRPPVAQTRETLNDMATLFSATMQGFKISERHDESANKRMTTRYMYNARGDARLVLEERKTRRIWQTVRTLQLTENAKSHKLC